MFPAGKQTPRKVILQIPVTKAHRDQDSCDLQGPGTIRSRTSEHCPHGTGLGSMKNASVRVSWSLALHSESKTMCGKVGVLERGPEGPLYKMMKVEPKYVGYAETIGHLSKKSCSHSVELGQEKDSVCIRKQSLKGRANKAFQNPDVSITSFQCQTCNCKIWCLPS